ncbi:MAG: hypothetical protein M3Q27_10655, partial [Actinomycetota bacterium]|nr:hypothetical protein [Actinomycetota bacterium]
MSASAPRTSIAPLGEVVAVAARAAAARSLAWFGNDVAVRNAGEAVVADRTLAEARADALDAVEAAAARSAS